MALHIFCMKMLTSTTHSIKIDIVICGMICLWNNPSHSRLTANLCFHNLSITSTMEFVSKNVPLFSSLHSLTKMVFLCSLTVNGEYKFHKLFYYLVFLMFSLASIQTYVKTYFRTNHSSLNAHLDVMSNSLSDSRC